MLARRLGKHRIVAETGAGQHGVATATVCARFGLECVVYMGEEDMRRQQPNVERMRLMGAEVRPVDFGTKTLKEATSEAIRDWIANVETTHYLIGSCVGPAPYPEIVAELQSVIGHEAREQFLAATGQLPEAVVACVGGGSNAIGIFHGFLDDADVRLVGVEAAGAASLGSGRAAVLHGARSSVLADEDGQIADAHSISAGLDYPGRRPRARVPPRHGPRGVPRRDRRRGARRVPRPRAHGGDHPRPRAGPRPRPRARPRRRADPRRPQRPRRQRPRRSVGAARMIVSDWDPARTAEYFDAFGEREWTRFEQGVTPPAGLDIHIRFLERFVRPGDRVLDAGAGPGRFSLELVRLGAEVVALDISPGQLEQLRARLPEIETHLGDVTDLSRFADGSFDVTVCYGGPLSYVLGRADETLAELVRVTRPGGHVLVSVMSTIGTSSTTSRCSSTSPGGTASSISWRSCGTGFLPEGAGLRAPRAEDVPLERARGDALPPREVVAAAASGLLPDLRPEEPELQELVRRIEAELCEEPVAISSGQHIVAALRLP